jgi:hypothetical protein
MIVSVGRDLWWVANLESLGDHEAILDGVKKGNVANLRDIIFAGFYGCHFAV